jgi:hypothetical protein
LRSDPASYAEQVAVRGRREVRPAPVVVRGAGVIVTAQGAAALAVAAVLTARGLAGTDQHMVNGFGTAAWFVLVGCGVSAAGSGLVAGRRWGRGLAVFTQLLLLPVAWNLAVDAHQAVWGIPVAVSALGGLALLLHPAAVRWAARSDERHPPGAADDGPDHR